jgi:serine/threonine protein kinase
VIPTLLNVGCDSAGQNDHYVRELVEGTTLVQLVASGATNLRAAIQVLSTIAGAVHRMHGLGIAHCNLRPATILVTSDGTPKLIGFGHVWPLAGAHNVPRGMSAVSAEIDVHALHEILAWLCARFHQTAAAPLEAVRQAGSLLNPGPFAEALGSCLRAI